MDFMFRTQQIESRFDFDDNLILKKTTFSLKIDFLLTRHNV